MTVSPDSRPSWNAFVAASACGDLLQCWEWGELKARTGWEPLHFAVREGEAFRAAALVLKRRLPRTGKCLFYCPRGPIVDFSDPDALAALLAEIRAGAREHGAIALKLDPAVPAASPEIAAALTAQGLCPASSDSGFGGVQPKSVMKVDLAPDEDTILAAFHAKWRYNVRLAAKKGVVVRADCPREDIAPFYDLLKITAERDGFRVRSRSYFQDMYDLIVAPGLGSLFMTYAEGVPVSGAIAFILGKQCWYVYGASDNEHRALMPNHLMQWEMMRWAKARSCTVYDMRGVSPEVAGEPTDPHLAGLNRFKRGFGAQYVEYIGDWDLVFSRLWHGLFQRALPTVKARLRRKADAAPDSAV